MADSVKLDKERVLLMYSVPNEVWAWCQQHSLKGRLFVLFDGGGTTGYLLEFEDADTKRRAEEKFKEASSRPQSPRGEEIHLLANFADLQAI